MKKTLSIVMVLAMVLTIIAACIPAMTVSAVEPVTVTFFDCDSMEGFAFSKAYELDTANKTQGEASLKFSFGDSMFFKEFGTAVDASKCDALEFDLYVTDVAALVNMTKGDSQIEIGSAKTNDKEELGWTTRPFLEKQITAEGWNHIVLPFKDAGVTGGDIDLSEVDWFRWYWVGADALIDVNLDNFVFTNWNAAPAKADTSEGTFTSTRVQGFTVYRNPDQIAAGEYDATEIPYLVENTAPSNGNSGNRGRYCDGNTYSIWKFDTTDAETARFVLTCHNECAFAVSTDGENWTEFYSSNGVRLPQETRSFVLDEYIDGNEMYIKAYDSKPDDGWGTYIMPIGTYFVTTQTKNYADYEDDAPIDVSFTMWKSDDYTDYVLSSWHAGITGSGDDSHPFYDRNIGDTKKFGGPQAVFAFPVNPKHTQAAVNLRLNSNYFIEVSTDFVNWRTLTAKSNTDMTGYGKYFDLSPYLEGTDMIFVKVRSPMDLDGNGPQIHTNAPIEFTSNNFGSVIFWDDLSTDENVYNKAVTHQLVYNEELDAVSCEYTEGNLIVRYGVDGAKPVDVRTMKWFEFDVYISEALPKGYTNQFVLELTNSQSNADNQEIQYTDFVLNKGWTHVVLPLPGNYVRSGSGQSGPIDLSCIAGFRLFNVTAGDLPACTFALKNLKFSRDLYVPNADWNMMTPNDNTWVKESKGFKLDVSDCNVVELDVYSADPKAIKANYGIRLELTSSGQCDKEEQEEVVSNYLYNAGWNHIVIPLNDNFDHTNLNYVRVHAQLGSGNKFSLRNIKFSYLPEFTDMINNSLISTCAGYNQTKAVAKADGTFSLNLAGANYIAMDIYFQDPQAFMANGAFACFEICSKNACDQEEYQWTFGSRDAHDYQCNIDVSELKAGWNHIELPIYIADVANGPVKDDIIYARLHVHGGSPISTAGAGWMAIKNVKAVAVDEGNKEAGVGLYGIIDPEAELIVDDTIEIDEAIVEDCAVDIKLNVLEEGDKNKYTYEVVKAFDITLVKGDAEIQPDGTVKLVLPKYAVLSSETLFVYHIHGDECTRLDYELDENGNIVVYVDGFSSFFYVKQAQVISGNPYTGDMIVVILAVVAVLAAGAFVFVLKKSRV